MGGLGFVVLDGGFGCFSRLSSFLFLFLICLVVLVWFFTLGVLWWFNFLLILVALYMIGMRGSGGGRGGAVDFPGSLFGVLCW